MGETLVAGAGADFLARGFAVFVGHHQRAAQPLVERVPMVELEFVAGESQRRAVLVVLLALSGRRERIHDGVFDAVQIEVLRPHEIEVARRQAAARRPRIAA